MNSGLNFSDSREAEENRRCLSMIIPTEKTESRARETITAPPNIPTCPNSSVKFMAFSFAPHWLALPHCPKWTCRALFLRGRTSTSRLLPFLAASLQSVSLHPLSLHPPSLPLLSLPAALPCVPVLLPSLAALLAAPLQPRASTQGAQARSRER